MATAFIGFVTAISLIGIGSSCTDTFDGWPDYANAILHGTITIWGALILTGVL